MHGDVFRPPRRSALLAAFVGSGVQLLCMTFIVLCGFIIFLLSRVFYNRPLCRMLNSFLIGSVDRFRILYLVQLIEQCQVIVSIKMRFG